MGYAVAEKTFLRGMDLRGLNCTGKDVSFWAVQTVFTGNLCLGVIAWICVHSHLTCHQENIKATQPTQAYDIKH